MINASEQDQALVRRIRKCACEMLDVCEILSQSGSKNIPSLYDTEQAMRRAAVQLFGYFPEPEVILKASNFRLQLPRSSPKTHTLTESSAEIGGYTTGPPL